MKNRISKKLAHLKEELRKRAIKEKDEEKRDDYWRLYFAARDAEYEVRELVQDAETRNILEIVAAYGLIDILMEDEKTIRRKIINRKRPIANRLTTRMTFHLVKKGFGIKTYRVL